MITRADAAYAAPPSATSVRDDDLDIPTLVSTLTDNKWPILIGTLVFMAVGFVVVFVTRHVIGAL